MHLLPSSCILYHIRTTQPQIEPGCGGLSAECHNQVESRTQGSRPRPRTQKKSEAKAKDSPSENRHSRGQGQECSRPRPRTKDTSASALKKKRSSQKFFRRSQKKMSSQKFFKRSPQKNVFQNIFQALHKILTIQKIVLSSDLRPRGQGLDLRGQGQGLQNVSSRPKTSSRTPPLVITTTPPSLQQCGDKMSYLNQMYEKKAMARA